MFRRHLQFLPLILLLLATTVQASDSYSAVASFFAEYDKMLEQVAVNAQKVTNLSTTEKILKKQIDEYSCASYFLRTNSKGKIIAKVTNKGIQPRAFRFVGKQKWFEIISMTNKPYYGYTKNRSSYYLFWNKPIHVNKRGALQFGGSISAKINMKKSFQTIAEEENVTFKVKLKNKILFSNLPKGATDLITKPLSIGGLPVLTISYPSDASSIATAVSTSSSKKETVSKSTPEKVETAKKVETPTKETTTQNAKTTEEIASANSETVKKEEAKKVETKKEPATKVEAKKEETEKPAAATEKKEKNISVVLLVIISAIVVLCIILVFMIVGNIRNQKLLEAIENGDV